MILQGEIWCWPLLGLKGLKFYNWRFIVQKNVRQVDLMLTQFPLFCSYWSNKRETQEAKKMIVNSKLYSMFDSYQDRDRCVLYGLMLIILKALHLESTTFWKSKEWQKQVIRLGGVYYWINIQIKELSTFFCCTGSEIPPSLQNCILKAFPPQRYNRTVRFQKSLYG